jgi:Dyp-type peroxidase family
MGAGYGRRGAAAAALELTSAMGAGTMLEIAEIQSLSLCPVLTPGWLERAMYLFLRFDLPADGARWLQRVASRVTSATTWSGEPASTVGVAISVWGLRALGISPALLDGFAFEFRQGMVARRLRGDSGTSAPSLWEGGLGTNVIHAMAVLAARDEAALAAERARIDAAGDGLAVTTQHVQDGHLLPDGREHFGFRDGFGQPTVEGTGLPPLPGEDTPLKAGEVIFGYEDELGFTPHGPPPGRLGRNGTYLVVRKLAQDVAAFRAFLRSVAADAADEERVAAKMVGRWRSGAPLVLAPDADDPALGVDLARNNDFAYGPTDAFGLRCPRGAHIRRANPRDSLVNVRRHRILRSGSAYGPPMPPGTSVEDGMERGVMFLAIGASIGRQFEFVHDQWMNDGGFVALGRETDPITGAHGAEATFTIPRRPVRRKLSGLPRFVTVRGGEYFFVPSLSGVAFLGELA